MRQKREISEEQWVAKLLPDSHNCKVDDCPEGVLKRKSESFSVFAL